MRKTSKLAALFLLACTIAGCREKSTYQSIDRTEGNENSVTSRFSIVYRVGNTTVREAFSASDSTKACIFTSQPWSTFCFERRDEQESLSRSPEILAKTVYDLGNDQFLYVFEFSPVLDGNKVCVLNGSVFCYDKKTENSYNTAPTTVPVGAATSAPQPRPGS